MKDRTARGTALGEPHRAAARRAHRSGHRHAHLRRRRVPVLRDAQRHGEEDAHVGVRLVVAHRIDRDQPQRRRRARPRHPDERQRRRLHGVAAGHDDPLLRRRRPADGPRHRRGARHEAEERPTTASSAVDVARDDAVLAVRVVERARQAHAACGVQPPGPGRAGRARHAGHRGPRPAWSRRSPSSPGDEILLFSSAGNLVRIGTDEISEQGRDATGVRVARVGDGDTVVAVARVLEAENGNGATGR